MSRITATSLMAVLGGLTGVISALVPEAVVGVLQPVSAIFFLEGSSVHPGLLFGLVVGLGVWWTGEKRAWIIALAFLITVLAWSAAMNAAHWIYEFKDERVLLGLAVERPLAGGATTVIKLLTGFLAGIVGAGTIAIGCAFFIPSLRGIVPVCVIILTGAVAGLLLYPLLSSWDDTLALLLLFSIWQACVGAAFGRGLSSPRMVPASF